MLTKQNENKRIKTSPNSTRNIFLNNQRENNVTLFFIFNSNKTSLKREKNTFLQPFKVSLYLLKKTLITDPENKPHNRHSL